LVFSKEGILALATIANRWPLEPADRRLVRSRISIMLKPNQLHMRVIDHSLIVE
jgi:hypothetical protein